MKNILGTGIAFLVFVLGFSPAQAATIEITIRKLTFDPGTVSAAAGDKIVWSNKDIMDHTATFEGAFDIVIPAGSTGTLIMTKAGTIRYYCRYHPNMVGTLEVEVR